MEVPVTLYSNMLTFRGNNRSFNFNGSLLETITNPNNVVSHSNPQDQKLIYEFGKELKFNIKQKRRKSNRDKTLIKMLKSPAIMASGFSNTMFLPSDPDDLCDRLKLLLQKRHSGIESDYIK